MLKYMNIHGRFIPYKMSGKKDVYQYKEEMS